ncbi:GntR family transcriptional regulator [Dactylosporangium sp. NPDC051484]|uniref:TetR/AcrR family transcriptional regulator n=1 Tax=Dactylosporangium sp. NPDC051484 TaxID=3154942 RepID=UPI0034506EF4
MTEPPYLRIVTELRGRIADGRLAPGDRVPSTRQLARQWGVALATATKALTVLKQEGWVTARPRAGTVVAANLPGVPVSGLPAGEAARVTGSAEVSPANEPAGGGTRRAFHGERGPNRESTPTPTREPNRELNRDQVVRAAIEIADAEGLDALSMRGVAARLGVSTMSTYRHVVSKDQLVVLMADATFGELGYAPPHPAGWRPLLERVARTMWALYRRHPWLAQVTPLTRPLPLPNLLLHGEQMMAALDGHGFDATVRLDLQVMLYSHVQGLAVQLEGEVQAQARSGLTEDEWMEVHGPALGEIAASGRYPGFTALMSGFAETGGYDLDLDKIFELGLRTMLDGLALQLDRPATPA